MAELLLSETKGFIQKAWRKRLNRTHIRLW